ncbi:MAG: CBS domain-containing protein [Euryarchaeota archaeon]|nr:CBS domain-containing protein [Euryarchaeota archaeon]
MSGSALVKHYMTKKVISVPPNETIEEVIKLMKFTNHDGFPVLVNDKVLGMITAFDILSKPGEKSVEDIMSMDVVVADQNMSLNDAARVMFRMGISRLPVIDKKGKLVGIITNTDIVRSHIERSTPMKVKYLKETLEQLYNVKTKVARRRVPIERLKPTQNKIYADELQGRAYELKRGLAEPTIVVKTGDRFILIDGHHRTVAAYELGYKEIDSYVIELDKDIRLGLEKTAESEGIYSLNDIYIIDDAQHPLIALTESLKKKTQKENREKENKK